MKSKKLKNKLKKKKLAKHKKTPTAISPQLASFRKKAPRRKVNIEISINSQAFKGQGSVFKLFD